MTKRTLKNTKVLAAVMAGAALASGRAPAAATPPVTPFILMVYCSGGWDPTMVFDDKAGSALVAQEPGAVAAVGAGNIPFVDHPARP